jgi:parvulin-like peptidyl-prolyl isomerase
MKTLSVLITVATVLGSAVSVRAQSDLVDAIRVIVHDSLITKHDITLLMIPALRTLPTQYRGVELDNQIAQADHDNMDQLVNRQLILHEFKTAGYSLPESVIDELVRSRIRSEFGDEVTLTRTLQARGITKEKFRQQIRDQFIERALREKNVSSEIIISPHKMETYYNQHKDSFQEPTRVKLRMIMLDEPREAEARRKLGEEVRAKLREGATFAEMANLYSKDSYRNQGGDHGWMEEKVLGKELAEAVAALKPGETSGVIETPEACWLVLMDDRKPTHIKPLSDVRDQIEKDLKLDEQKRLEAQWIERLKKKTYVKTF